MSCKIKEKTLALFVGGELTHRKTKKLAAHINECQRCAQKVKELKWSCGLLQKNSEVPELNNDFWDQLKKESIARIKTEASQRKKLIKPLFSQNRLVPVLVSLLLIVSAVIIYNQFYKTAPPLPTPNNKTIEKSSYEKRKETTPIVQKERRGIGKQNSDTQVAEERRRPKISEEQGTKETKTPQASLASQNGEEQQTVMTFYYEEPKIKVIWIYKN